MPLQHLACTTQRLQRCTCACKPAAPRTWRCFSLRMMAAISGSTSSRVPSAWNILGAARGRAGSSRAWTPRQGCRRRAGQRGAAARPAGRCMGPPGRPTTLSPEEGGAAATAWHCRRARRAGRAAACCRAGSRTPAKVHALLAILAGLPAAARAAEFVWRLGLCGGGSRLENPSARRRFGATVERAWVLHGLEQRASNAGWRGTHGGARPRRPGNSRTGPAAAGAPRAPTLLSD